jgi:iron complex transport system substrate-binding protein
VKPIDDITRDVIGVAMSIHRDLGPGLLESVYEAILAAKLLRMGYKVDRQKPVDIRFEDVHVEGAFRIDILVDDRLVIEIKSLDQLHKVHAKQLLTYLRLMQQPVGLILNFGGETMKEGVRRLVNNHIDSALSAPLREQNITE